MLGKLLCILALPYISIGIHILYRLEVDPSDFVLEHKKQIKGDPESVFEFLTSTHALEKLLPWLMRFREADTRIISVGKSYSAIVGFPVVGEKNVHAILSEYKPWQRLVFDFSDDYFRQRIIIQTHHYHDRTLLQTTIFFRRTSFVHQYTLGGIARMILKSELEVSMKNFAKLFETLDGPYDIPDFSRKIHK